jgi:hypothetical protein
VSLVSSSELPGAIAQLRGQHKRLRLRLGVEQDQKAVVDNAIALAIGAGNFFPVEKDPDRFGFGFVPIFVTDFGAVDIEPANVIHPRAMNFAPLKPVAPLKDRMSPAKGQSGAAQR